MYNEIRESPLAEEIKQQYEDAIAEWSDRFSELQSLYNQLQSENDSLHDELDHQKQVFVCLYLIQE